MSRSFLAGWCIAGSLVLALACQNLQPVSPKVLGPVILEAKDTICVLSKLGEPVAQIIQECNLVQDQLQAVLTLIGEAKKQGVSVTTVSGGRKATP